VVVTTDSSVLLAGNLTQLVRQGHHPDALAGKWDEMTCDSVETFDCEDPLTGASEGTGQTRVVCESDAPSAIETTFDDSCQIFGTTNDGSMSIGRDGILAFDGFEVGSVRQLDGRLEVDAQVEQERSLALAEGAEMTVSTNAGKSCEETTTFRRFAVEDADASVTLSIDASRTSSEKTYTVTSQGDPMQWSKPVDCPCPGAGAVVDLSLENALGLDETGTMRVSYGAGDGDSCATATVEITTWPSACEEVEDCGRDVIEGLVGDLVTAACVPIEEPEE
jgi:hypothetical protein